MEFIIDNRESKIKEYYNQKILNNEKVQKEEYKNFIKFENLDLGDFVIKYN